MQHSTASILCMLTLGALMWTSPAHAISEEELEQAKKEILNSQKRQEKLAEQAEKIEQELQPLQENLVRMAASIQKGELVLSDAEEKLRILSEQVKVKNTILKKQQKYLDMLVQAALSLSRTPPEAMIMMPEGAMESMKTGRALKMASDDIRRETISVSIQLAELKKLETKVHHDRDALAARQATLDKDRQSLVTRLSERSALLKKLGAQRQEELDKLAKLAKKSQDMQDLLSSLEKERHLHKDEDEEPVAKASRSEMRSFAKARGQIRSPVAGKVIQNYGSQQGKNATSKGILVSVRNGARVTAPYDGQVVFTGPFLNYGQMVIIRHSDDFHTLLAGLVKIDATVGQFLLEGEPIGAMGDSETGNHLYIELRKNNKPVDPSHWIKGISKKN